MAKNTEPKKKCRRCGGTLRDIGGNCYVCTDCGQRQ